MIISASRRTDIPNYYGEWFFNRIKEGFCCVRNPMNPHQVSRICLSPDVVDAIVFWTKNPENMLDRLEELKEYNYQYGNGLLTAVTDIWTECEPLLTKYGSDIVKLLQAQKDAEQEQKKNIGDSENPSVKGMTTAQVQEAIKPKNTQTNTDEDNSNLVDRLIDGGWNKGKVWYDKKNKVIYMGDQGDRRITAHAYKLI